MTNLSNLTDISDLSEVIRLYSEATAKGDNCWNNPTFWMMLVMLATQYLKPLFKSLYKQRQKQKQDSSRKSTSTLATSDA